MTIGWPAAIVIASLVFAGMVIIVTLVGGRMAQNSQREELAADGTRAQELQALTAEYTKLAADTREMLGAMQGDLAAVKTAVESIETMMRDVA